MQIVRVRHMISFTEPPTLGLLRSELNKFVESFPSTGEEGRLVKANTDQRGYISALIVEEPIA